MSTPSVSSPSGSGSEPQTPRTARVGALIAAGLLGLAATAGCHAGSPAISGTNDPAGAGGGGGQSSATQGEGGAAQSGAGGVSTTSGGDGGSGGATSTSAECEALAAAIAKETGGVQTCTAVVRLDYQTRAAKSYRILCAPYAATSESAARAAAEASTGFGTAGQALAGKNPVDEHVFWQSPGDFGGVGVVSARSGLPVFGGSIVWGGAGEVSYPDTFESPAGLGAGCKSASSLPTARGFHLGSGQPLPEGEVTAALKVVWGTALPSGLWKNNYVFDAMVLLYPPSVGALDPAVAEWVVLVNSGWLE